MYFERYMGDDKDEDDGIIAIENTDY